jgi:hypothetical protein
MAEDAKPVRQSEHLDKSGDKTPDGTTREIPLEGRGADEARHSDAGAMAAIEKRRTNRSSGSLAAEQEHSIELQMDDGNIISRRNQDAIKATPADTSGPVLKAGLVYQETPIKNTGVQNIEDLEQKFRGVADGLGDAMMANISQFAKDPQATNKGLIEIAHKTGETISHITDKIAKHDTQNVLNQAGEIGQKIVDASNKYSAMSQYEQGHFIGKEVMPNFIPDLPQTVSEVRSMQAARQGEGVFYHAIEEGKVPAREPQERLALTGAGGDWPVLNKRISPDVVQQIHGKSCVSACGEMVSEGRLKQEDLMKNLGTPADTRRLSKQLGPEWAGRYYPELQLPDEVFHGGPFVADLREHTIPGHRAGDAHAVVVDGLDEAGNVRVRDPQDGERYEMTRKEFEKFWTGCIVYRAELLK